MGIQASVDCLGRNIWVWAKRSKAGLRCLKKASEYCPHVEPIRRESKSKAKQHAAKQVLQFTDEHKEIESALHGSGFTCVFDPDLFCWKTHTKAFEKIAPRFKGKFITNSPGNRPHMPNCHAYPQPDGSVRVVRYGSQHNPPTEHESWHHGENFTWTMFNAPVGLKQAAAIMGGVPIKETTNTLTYEFMTASDLEETIQMFADGFKLELPEEASAAYATLKRESNGSLVASVKTEERVSGWSKPNRNGFITRVLPAREPESQTSNNNAFALVAGGKLTAYAFRDEYDRYIITKSQQVIERHLNGNKLRDIERNAFELTAVPFQPEFVGQRTWNRNAPQWKYDPVPGDCPHWETVVAHWGRSLNSAVASNKWCQEHGIHCGYEYLFAWIANLFKRPEIKLPWLFFYGPQGCGKSSFHEFLSLLLTGGVVQADLAIRSDFNSELAGAVLAYCSETDLSSERLAPKIKDLVTTETLSIREMHMNVYQVKSYLHWCSSGNQLSDAPEINNGDTRFTCIETFPLGDEAIPKPELKQILSKEAPQFLHRIKQAALPKPESRLAIPALDTVGKAELMKTEFERDSFDRFIDERVRFRPLARVSIADFKTTYIKSCDEWQMPAISDVERVQRLRKLGVKDGVRLLSQQDSSRPKAYQGIELK